ncbi:MAG: nucleotidyltransferase domain-containing protein [Prolixibacteraceae bacterium]
MMTETEKNISKKIHDRIKQKDLSAEVILYGSHARGDSHADSDWDILVLLDREDVSLKTEQEFRHHLFDLELEIGQPISIFVHSKKNWESKYFVTPYYRNIKKEGVLLT